MSKIEVDAITEQSGTTLTTGGGAGKTVVVDATTVTLGRCGGTVALASGASQSGFGRSGSVNWQTTIKTGDFTAANGEGYFVDTGSGVVTVTLPGSPAAGNIVYIKDYDGNFETNKCTIARNGSNIRGEANNINLEQNNAGAVFIYVDATEGWQIFFDGSDADALGSFIKASGGTETTCGNFKIHTFTGPGTFTVSEITGTPTIDKVDYLVVGGGGAGSVGNAGGGGAGGYRESHCTSVSGSYTASPLAAPNSPSSASLPVLAQGYSIVVGGGGASTAFPSPGSETLNPGSVSTFSTITSAGGGFGGKFNHPSPSSRNGGPGGSGGGGSISTPGSVCGSSVGGTGNTPPVSPAQGTTGGTGFYAPNANSGGGGGGASEGSPNNNSTAPSGPGSNAGRGGAGTSTAISGTTTAYAGGGGGGAGATCKGGATSPCGTGGFGGGNSSTSTPAPSRGAPQPLQPSLPSAASTAASSGVINRGGGGGGTNSAASGGSGS
jgi:hypothetical protein